MTTTIIQRKGKRQRGTALHRGISNMEKWLKRPSVSDIGQTDSDSREKKKQKIESKKRLHIFFARVGLSGPQDFKKYAGGPAPQKRLRTTDLD